MKLVPQWFRLVSGDHDERTGTQKTIDAEPVFDLTEDEITEGLAL